MKTQVEVLLQVARALDEVQIPYVVVGSVASSLLGFSRATADVDIVADLQAAQVLRLFDALKDDFYVDEQAMRRAVGQRRSFNAIHFDSLFKVDVYILPADEFSRRQLDRRRREQLLPDASQAIYLATPEDTILAKLRWHRRGGAASERQLTDAAGVIKVQGERLDFDYLREWADRLGVRDLLDKLLGEAADN
jgi:hypothetical protein